MIKVFIIDDSLLARSAIKKILSKEEDIIVIGEAQNPVDAYEVFKTTGLPDVFVLDLEMPKMDGLTFLKKLKEQKPIPTVICSSYVESGSNYAIESLRNGASDIVLKPKGWTLKKGIELIKGKKSEKKVEKPKKEKKVTPKIIAKPKEISKKTPPPPMKIPKRARTPMALSEDDD